MQPAATVVMYKSEGTGAELEEEALTAPAIMLLPLAIIFPSPVP